jgi:predicted RNA-binding protein YlxR (DUF448 family)
VRTCIGCRRRAGVDDLVRITADAHGDLVVGRTAPGRGAWLCAGDPGCFVLAAKRKAFARALRRPVAEAAMTALAGQLGIAAGDAPGRPVR